MKIKGLIALPLVAALAPGVVAASTDVRMTDKILNSVSSQMAGGVITPVWGSVGQSRFKSDTGDGDSSSVSLGVTSSISDFRIGFGVTDIQDSMGSTDTGLTSVHPSVGMRVNDVLTMWMTAGAGIGSNDYSVFGAGVAYDVMPIGSIETRLVVDGASVKSKMETVENDFNTLRGYMDASWEAGKGITPRLRLGGQKVMYSGMSDDRLIMSAGVDVDLESNFVVSLDLGSSYSDMRDEIGVVVSAKWMFF